MEMYGVLCRFLGAVNFAEIDRKLRLKSKVFPKTWANYFKIKTYFRFVFFLNYVFVDLR